MKAVITDYTFPSLDIEEAILKAAGAELVFDQCKTSDALVSLVHDADVVITQFAPITADVISKMEKSLAIVRYGIGVDNVDLDAAKGKGIPVCNIPAYCIDEVADQTLAFILAATRCVVANCTQVRNGSWGLAVPITAMQCLRDLTVGIVGFGRIGREVASRLAPFKCQRVVFDPAVSDGDVRQTGCEPNDFQELLGSADIITLHCPSSDATRGLINEESISQMKQDAVLINVGRGDLVKTDALIQALQSEQLGAACLDVFDPEPVPTDSPLLEMENVVVSSHVASASLRASRTLRETAAEIAATALLGKPLPNVVNGV